MTEVGQGMQVVQVLEDHTYRLDEAALGGVLLRPDVRDLPVVVLSVAGAFRRGKSFLLNFFIRYLTSPPSSRKDGSWIGQDKEPLTGFSWRGGLHRNTTGVLLWSEPFVLTLPSGEQVAVLLMDTQGTFDNQSNVRDCSTIFALSTLLSSVQIYNLSTQIQEDDLQHLQLFTEYGKMVHDQEGSKAFQVLEFLIRDWPNSEEYPYGSTGGKQFLETKLKIKPYMPKELQDVRTHIISSFESVNCFLMPHPGLNVIKKTFNGQISEIDPDFLTYTKDLAASLLAPENLIPKRINGELVRAKDLYTYFKTYMTLFNSDKIPSTHTILEATVEAAMLTGQNDARAVYEEGMEAECGAKQPRSLPGYDVQELHHIYLGKARAAFTNKKKMGTLEVANSYLERLTRELEDRLPMYQESNMAKTQSAINAAKGVYEQEISDMTNGKILCVHPKELLQVHKEAFEAAKKIFDDSRKTLSAREDTERKAFLDSFENRYKLLRLNNEQNNHTLVVQLRLDYWSDMMSRCSTTPPLSETALQGEHDAALARAIELFHSKRNRSSTSYPQDDFEYNLIQNINATYVDLKAINKSNNKAALQAAVAAYDQHVRATWEPAAACLHPAALAGLHRAARCHALAAFRPHVACDGDFDDADSDARTLLNIISRRYEELKRVNESANEAAVQLSFNVYCSMMDEFCRPTLWWLLLVPILVYLTKKPEYHAAAAARALDIFRSKRQRSDTSPRDDPYLNNLNNMMQQAFSKY